MPQKKNILSITWKDKYSLLCLKMVQMYKNDKITATVLYAKIKGDSQKNKDYVRIFIHSPRHHNNKGNIKEAKFAKINSRAFVLK